MRAMPTRLTARTLTAATLGIVLIAGGRAAGPKFFPDDPIWHDPETQDAAGVRAQPLSDRYDYLESSYLDAGDRTDTRALNVNSVDEVPDSSWFTNRIGRRAMTGDEIARGPDTGTGPTAPGHHRRQDARASARASRSATAPDRSTSSSSIRRRTPRWRAAPRSSPRSSCTPSATTCRRTTSRRCGASTW